MGYYLTSLAMLAVVLMFALAFVNASPSTIAGIIRFVGPLMLLGIGAVLTLAGRAVIGIPLVFFGATWFARNRRVSRIGGSSNTNSTVRSAWLEMQLDHDSGDLDGQVLVGPLEGKILSELDEENLLALYEDLRDDADSVALMEAYLDRRLTGWRENVNPHASTGSGSASSSGPMTKQEAYQVLGLPAGAGPEEIRSAHRRLMKAVHPDSGGSTFLAARINEAKDTLLQ